MSKPTHFNLEIPCLPYAHRYRVVQLEFSCAVGILYEVSGCVIGRLITQNFSAVQHLISQQGKC